MSVPGRSQLVPLPSQSPLIACHVLQELFWFEPFGIYFGDVFLRERCCDCRWFCLHQMMIWMLGSIILQMISCNSLKYSVKGHKLVAVHFPKMKSNV